MGEIYLHNGFGTSVLYAARLTFVSLLQGIKVHLSTPRLRPTSQEAGLLGGG